MPLRIVLIPSGQTPYLFSEKLSELLYMFVIHGWIAHTLSNNLQQATTAVRFKIASRMAAAVMRLH